MGRRAHKALASYTVANGIVHIRKAYSKKQGSWILILEGPHAGLRQLLPEWMPKVPSTRTQLSLQQPTKRVSDILAFFQHLAPVFYQRLSGNPVPVATPSLPPPTYQTLGQAMRVIEHEAQTSLRTGSITTYRYQGAALMRVLPPDTLLTSLTRERLQGVIGELAGSYASTTVGNIRNLLSKVLIRAVEDRVLAANPLTKVKVPKLVAKMQTVLSRDQRDAVLREAEARVRDMHLLFHILLGTGLRRSEALALTWADVDLERRLLSIRSSEHFLTKTGNARSVPIPIGLFEQLSRASRSSGFVLKPNQPYANARYRWDFSKGFAAVVQAAGVPFMTAHSCRHHYASWFLEQGGSVFRLAAALGHALVETSERYAHLVPGFGASLGQPDSGTATHSISA